MEDKKEYLSVKDFAQKAGVSTQAIYQRLDKDLQTYCKVVGKQKTIDIKALELFAIKTAYQSVDQLVGKDLQTTLQEILNHFASEKQDNSNDSEVLLLKELVITLQDTLKTLKEQIDVKDKQIEELNARLKEANQLNQNNQILLLGKQEPPQQIEEAADKKKSFWERLFGEKM